MESKDLELIEELKTQNDELRLLMAEHLALEGELDKYQEKSYLTPSEELEKKRLQKLKLAGRDRIEEILQEHRNKG